MNTLDQDVKMIMKMLSVNIFHVFLIDIFPRNITHCQNCWISYPRKSGKFKELPLFLNQENLCGFPLQGKAETGTIGPRNLIANITIATFPLGNQLRVSNRKTLYQNFLVGNLLKISLAFPFDFLLGKPKNTCSDYLNNWLICKIKKLACSGGPPLNNNKYYQDENITTMKSTNSWCLNFQLTGKPVVTHSNLFL